MSSILIRGGLVTDDKSSRRADVLIRDGLIAKVDSSIGSSDIDKDTRKNHTKQ